ncbi:MAG: hypothetical protein AAB211_02830 [Pseudomonadota bacterium]|jgi:cobalt-zinc-cadmium efflux system protein
MITNGVDHTSDSIVHVITLLTLIAPPVWKRATARFRRLLILFAVGILIDVGRRFLNDPEPLGYTMMVTEVLAAAVNAQCFWLLRKIQVTYLSGSYHPTVHSPLFS